MQDLGAAGLGDEVTIDSAGTTAWEEGNPADPRTLEVMRRNGHETDYSAHRARVFDKMDVKSAVELANLLRDLPQQASS